MDSDIIDEEDFEFLRRRREGNRLSFENRQGFRKRRKPGQLEKDDPFFIGMKEEDEFLEGSGETFEEFLDDYVTSWER